MTKERGESIWVSIVSAFLIMVITGIFFDLLVWSKNRRKINERECVRICSDNGGAFVKYFSESKCLCNRNGKIINFYK